MQVDRSESDINLSEESADTPVEVKFDGSWERSGRSLNTAAVVALLGIGVLYFNAQTLFSVIAIAFAKVSNPPVEEAADFLARLAQTLELYATPILLAIVVTQYLFMLLPALLVVKRWHTKHIGAYIRFRNISITEIFLAILTTLATIPTGVFIANELTSRLDMPDILNEINAKLFTAHSFGEFIWLVFVIAVTPAICEEVFFRGYIQRTFERTINSKSIWLVGVIFGLYHMQPLGLITLSLLGILFGYFYFRSQSLYPAIAAHFTNNFLAIFLLYQAPKVSGVDLNSSEQLPIVWVLLTAPLALALLYLYHKVTARRHGVAA